MAISPLRVQHGHGDKTQRRDRHEHDHAFIADFELIVSEVVTNVVDHGAVDDLIV